MKEFTKSELERIKSIRESDITRDIHKFDEAFRTALKARKREQTSNELPTWATYLMENPIKTKEQLKDFHERCPDAKGEVIMMQIMKLSGKLGL